MNEQRFGNKDVFRDDGASQRKDGSPFQRRRGNSLLQPGIIVDYKDFHLLRNFLTQNGKIVPRRISRLTASQQRSVTVAIKRARHLALLGYCDRHDRSK